MLFNRFKFFLAAVVIALVTTSFSGLVFLAGRTLLVLGFASSADVTQTDVFKLVSVGLRLDMHLMIQIFLAVTSISLLPIFFRWLKSDRLVSNVRQQQQHSSNERMEHPRSEASQSGEQSQLWQPADPLSDMCGIKPGVNDNDNDNSIQEQDNPSQTCPDHQMYVFSSRYSWLAAICLSVSALSVMINFFYYRTYGNTIDVFFFNFFNEDIAALAATLWSGYPILGIAVSVVVLCCLFRFLALRLARFGMRKILKVESRAVVALIFAVAATSLYWCYFGGFTTKVIRSKAVLFSSISTVKVINDARANPLSLIHRNFKEYREARTINPVKITYGAVDDVFGFFGIGRQFGGTYGTEMEANGKRVVADEPGLSAQQRNKREKDNLLSDPVKIDVLRSLEATTKLNPYLEEHKPNVVLVLSESLSSHMASFSADTFDVISELKESLDSDYYFPNFISEGVATQKSLVRLLLRAPYYTLPFHPGFAQLSFETFAFKPYLEQGYEVYYITGSECSWGNMKMLLQSNGVSNFICSNDVMKKYPEAEYLYWGIPDEYLYRYAEDLLAHTEKPTAIFILNTTNHPPYELPSDYHGHELLLFPQEVFEVFHHQTAEEIRGHFRTYRYAAEMLGKFIKNIKSSAATRDNTFVAYTGDHNARIGIYDYARDSAITGKGVVFGLYVPEAYREHDSIAYDSQRLGSHKDIMPTLIEHTLSNQRYIKLGCDLLSDAGCPFDFGYNEEILATYDNHVSCGNESTEQSIDTSKDCRHKTGNIMDSAKNSEARENFNQYTKLLQIVFALQVE